MRKCINESKWDRPRTYIGVRIIRQEHLKSYYNSIVYIQDLTRDTKDIKQIELLEMKAIRLVQT